MSRKRATDGSYCIRLSIGYSPVHAVSLVPRFFSAVRYSFAPLRGLAADIAFIPFATRTRRDARAVITISMRARGERRAPRFNY